MNPTIVISMPADDAIVSNLVGALSENDLDIFWERTPPSSAEWEKATRRVAAARAVAICWSRAALDSDAARFLALTRRVIAAKKAILIRLDGAPIPDELAGSSIYDLRGRRALGSSLFMLDVIAAVKAKAAGLDPPLPRAPRQLLLKRLALLVPLILGLIVLIELYRNLGLDQIAGPEEARAWAAVRPGRCDDLRAFLRAHSAGVHADEAQALLASRTVRNETRSKEVERPLPFFVSAGTEVGAATEARARQIALTRAQSEATRNCGRLAQAGSAGLRSSQIGGAQYECERFQSGYVCSLRGDALCRLTEPEQVSVESCAR